MAKVPELLKKIGDKFVEQQKKLVSENCDGMIRIGEQLERISDFFKIGQTIEKKENAKEKRAEILNAYMHGQISYETKEGLLDKPENRRVFSLVDIASIMNLNFKREPSGNKIADEFRLSDVVDVMDIRAGIKSHIK